MTVQSEVSKVQFLPNGVSTSFAVSYFFLADGDLEVIVTTAAGLDVLQVLTTDYTVTGALNPSGGSVDFVIAPVSGTRLTISRVPEKTQLTDYISNDNFPAESHERALDLLTMLTQLVCESLSRAIQFPKGEDITRNNFLSDSVARSNQILGFDSVGDLTLFAFSSIAVPAPGTALVTVGTPTGSTNTKTISINIAGTPNFLVSAWLVDTNALGLVRTINPPDGNGVADFEEITDSNGDVIFSFTHNGAATTWFLIMDIDGVLILSAAINLG